MTKTLTTNDLGANAAAQFPGENVEHLGGARYIIGGHTRYIADEGDGSFEGEDGFDAAWEAERHADAIRQLDNEAIPANFLRS